MRIVLTTSGTIGSIEPMIGLAQACESRGHSVEVVAPEPLASRARDLAPTFTLTSVRSAGQLGTTTTRSEQVRANLETQAQAIPDYFEQLRARCEKADLLIGFPFQLAAPMVRDALGIPYVSLHFSPFSTASSREAIASAEDVVNPLRERLGLPPLHDPLGVGALSPTLALFAVSSAIFRRPRNWPEHHKLVGYFFSEDRAAPSTELTEFLDENCDSPPVVVTFGSIVHDEPGVVTQILLSAGHQLDEPMVIQSGWSGLGARDHGKRVCVTGFVPHKWLFSKAKCVVHAGGAGTTAAALRAGVPAVVVPHLLDQPFWAALVRSAKCGVSLPFSKLSVEALVDAVKEVTQNETYACGAHEMAEKIAAEDGPSLAVSLIEEKFG